MYKESFWSENMMERIVKNKILHTVVGFHKMQVWDVKYDQTFLDSFHEIHLNKSPSSNKLDICLSVSCEVINLTLSFS